MEQKKTVLVVDDQPDVANTLSEILQKAGYHVKQANSGEEGLAKAKEQGAVHVVLLDIMMPTLSGYTVAERLRDMYGENVKILFVTIKPRSEVDLRMADGFIQKPFDIKEVLTQTQKLAAEDTQ